MSLFNAFEPVYLAGAVDTEECNGLDPSFCGCCDTPCAPSIGESYPASSGTGVCCKCCCQTQLNWLQLLCQLTGPDGFSENFSLWSSSYAFTSAVSGYVMMPRCGWVSVTPIVAGAPLTSDLDAYGNTANRWAVVMAQDPANSCKFTMTITSTFLGRVYCCNDTAVIDTTDCFDCDSGLPLVFSFSGCLSGYTCTVGLDIPDVGSAVEQCGGYSVPMGMALAEPSRAERIKSALGGRKRCCGKK